MLSRSVMQCLVRPGCVARSGVVAGALRGSLLKPSPAAPGRRAYSEVHRVITSADVADRSDGVAARWSSSHKLEVNGVHLHFEKAGAGKHVVLLLPGALGSSQTDFEQQFASLNKDMFTLIGWDPRGYGKSRPPERDWPDHFLARDAEDAAHLMDSIMESEENLSVKKFSLMGWSDGGITAMILAGKYPQRVHKLVVWGANAYLTEPEVAVYQKIANIDSWSEKMRKPFVDMYGEDTFRRMWKEWVEAFSAYYYTHNKGDICKGDLPNIVCPTLIVHGAKDPMVGQFHADYLKDNIKKSYLVNMPEGKHNLHMRYHKEFHSIVEDFLTQPQ